MGYPTGRYPVDADHRYAPGPGVVPFNSGPSGPPPIDSRFPPTSENRFPVGNERFPLFIYKYGNRERFPSGTGACSGVIKYTLGLGLMVHYASHYI